MTKSEAERIGRKMKTRLGKGWEIHIHENIGWWVKATRGPLYVSGDIHPYKKDKITYSCLMSSDPKNYPNCGEMYWTTHGKSFSDPQNAVKHQIKVAKEFTNNLNTVVKEASVISSDFNN